MGKGEWISLTNIFSELFCLSKNKGVWECIVWLLENGARYDSKLSAYLVTRGYNKELLWLKERGYDIKDAYKKIISLGNIGLLQKLEYTKTKGYLNAAIN